MHARKIRVKNGRLVLDEATELPDGAEVDVVVIDDELTAEERAELHASLDRALDDSDAGRAMDAWEFLDRYRARLEIVLLDEAQERFEAEDRWWREHRDAKELFITEFQEVARNSPSRPPSASGTVALEAS